MEEFKKQLYSQLKDTGVVSQLRSQLRAQLVQQLQKGTGGAALGQPALQRGAQLTIWHKAMNSLIADYLAATQLHFSASVFLQEAGLSPSDALSQRELLQLLGIREGSPAHAYLTAELGAAENAPCLATALLQALQRLASEHGPPAASEPLEQNVPHNALALRPAPGALVPAAPLSPLTERPSALALEHHMLAYRAECDERVRQEIARQVAHLRDVELTALRLEEGSKHRCATSSYS